MDLEGPSGQPNNPVCGRAGARPSIDSPIVEGCPSGQPHNPSRGRAGARPSMPNPMVRSKFQNANSTQLNSPHFWSHPVKDWGLKMACLLSLSGVSFAEW